MRLSWHSTILGGHCINTQNPDICHNNTDNCNPVAGRQHAMVSDRNKVSLTLLNSVIIKELLVTYGRPIVRKGTPYHFCSLYFCLSCQRHINYSSIESNGRLQAIPESEFVLSPINFMLCITLGSN